MGDVAQAAALNANTGSPGATATRPGRGSAQPSSSSLAVASTSPVSSHVFRPKRIIGQRARAAAWGCPVSAAVTEGLNDPCGLLVYLAAHSATMARSPGPFDRLGRGAVLLAHRADSLLPEMQRLANQEQGEPDHPCEQDHRYPLDGSLDRLAVLVLNRVWRAYRWRVVVIDLGQRLVHLAEPRAL